MPAPAADSALPEGLRIELNADVRSYDEGRTLLNRTSGRLLRLRAGASAQIDLLAQGAASPAGRRLGRRLLTAGIAHPRPEPARSLSELTVIVPVLDRPDAVDRCLAALGAEIAVVVVDDGSVAPSAIELVGLRHGATYLARSTNGGPAAARNTGLSAVTTPLIAFVDSDCVVSADDLARLAGHFVDPLVGAVAPRIMAADGTSPVASALDLGAQPALVTPGGRVSYVPTAVLLVRTDALADLGAQPFDEGLRFGEDVDLVWRLHDAGWWVRYEPDVTAIHAEPIGWRALARRRFLYGTSAGPLARRHPDRLAPWRWSWPTALALVALGLRRPTAALVVYLGTSARLYRILSRQALPPWTAPTLMARAFFHNGLGLASALNQLAPGLALIAALRQRRLGLALWGLAPLALEWRRARPNQPWRWWSTRCVNDAAYGAGVWWGAVKARTARPLLPRRTGMSKP